jgi:formamidopyrimidine-DNA glycosylase
LGIVGSRVTDVERIACRRRPIAIVPRMDRFRKRAIGHVVTEIGRVGKRVVVHLDSQDAIVLEPRMSGLVLVADPPTREHLRFRCTLSGNGIREFLYWDRRGLGNVRLISPNEFEEAFGPSKVGPDALIINGEMLRERLGRSARAVKVALLDQRAVAGIGNMYASEIVHLAGVHPAKACSRITRSQWEAIAEATHEVLNAAIRCEGSTLRNGTYRNALNQPGGYQSRHRVYDKAGEPCSVCGVGSRVMRIVQAQRATFFCPGCQRKR